MVQWYSIGPLTEKLRFKADSTHLQLQATLSKLLTYCVLRPIQPPTISRTGNRY